MIFLHHLIPALISPVAILGYLLILSMILKSRWPRLLAIILLCLSGNPIIANSLIKFLERDFPPISLKELPKFDTVIVLSGMISTVGTKSGVAKYEFNEAVDRLEAGLELLRLNKTQELILTRGHLPWSIGIPEGDFLKEVAIQRGFRPENIWLTAIAQNTEQEAENIFHRVQDHKTIALITSAFHMPRALKIFKAKGLNVIPIAVDHRHYQGKLRPTDFLISGQAFSATSWAIREIMGRAYYNLKY